MKGSSYRDRDYVFGQAMLSLRITIGLTQAGLARHLGISRKAVGEWEAGITYPKAEHLKAFIALAGYAAGQCGCVLSIPAGRGDHWRGPHPSSFWWRWAARGLG